ncbi:hypothetical protein NDI56_17605 [Haloarcula sp. S1CR25-12]|uniref:Uncharacterized protein n=1 Tax=Haloarcula saliterrae TaxID=2950534 RepID=A0ABU2FG65_9EURY|nr:hypothetical protein [Haloarcula sp. S1CR25-12]MDS0261219.1 hypothetical protein [Haloarcula sp. S1CR25-12]
MKQGSADDPFADEAPDEAAGDAETDADSGLTDGPATESDSTDGPATDSGLASPETSPADTLSSQSRSLPYIHSRDGVKDGRTQRPVFLRDHIEAGIDDLVTQMEAEFGEDVYKTDVTEAAMAIAEERPELVREKLDEWGYGWS